MALRSLSKAPPAETTTSAAATQTRPAATWAGSTRASHPSTVARNGVRYRAVAAPRTDITIALVGALRMRGKTNADYAFTVRPRWELSSMRGPAL